MPDASEHESRISGAEIVVGVDRVTKRQAPARARFEREHTRWGERVGRESGLFRVPRVESYDDASGEIVFERIADAQPLARFLAEPQPAEALLTRSARALATIHSASHPSATTGAPDAASLHGDFGLGNLLYCAARNELVILDWCSAWWLGPSVVSCRASPSVDLTTFAISLFYRQALRAGPIAQPERALRVFLDGYVAARRPRFELVVLRAELPGILARFQAADAERTGWLRALAYRSSLRHLRRFVAGDGLDPT